MIKKDFPIISTIKHKQTSAIISLWINNICPPGIEFKAIQLWICKLLRKKKIPFYTHEIFNITSQKLDKILYLYRRLNSKEFVKRIFMIYSEYSETNKQSIINYG